MTKKETQAIYNSADELKEIIEAFRSAPKDVQNLVMTILKAPKEEKTEIMKSRNIEWSPTKEGMC